MSDKPKRKTSTLERQRRLLIAGLALLCGVLLGGIVVFGTLRGQAVASATSTPSALPTYTPSPFEGTGEGLPFIPLDSTATPVQTACFFSWAYGDVPQEYIDILNTALVTAGYNDFELIMSAYGEDEICQKGDEIVSSRFLMMDVSPAISLSVDNATLNNNAQLGGIAREIITIIQSFESYPIVNIVEIEFALGANTKTWTVSYATVTTAIADGISDTDLFALSLN